MRHHLFTVGRSSHRALLLFQPRLSPPSHPAPTCEPYTSLAFSAASCQRLSGRRGRVELSSNLTRKKPSGSFRMSSVDTPPSPQAQGPFGFGPYRIGLEEVFLTTKLSFAFVNLRPVVPDVLVCPKRVVPRFADLSADEVTDLLLTAQRVGEKVEHFFNGSSLTISIQDGPEAGQTVPHVHVHILPRRQADFKNNDEIYDEIDKKEKELGKSLNLDEERKDRTPELMHEEATKLRALF